MKSIPPSLATHLQGELSTLAWLVAITRSDGTVLAFTTHDRPLVVGGITHAADGSFTASAVETPAGLAPANAEVVGMVSSNAITDADIRAGRYDGATITISVCNWADTAAGSVTIRRGSIGTITHDAGTYRFEIKGLVDTLAQTIGHSYTKTCRHRLGDTGCTVGTTGASYTKSGTLTGVTSATTFTDTARTEPASFFANGSITFTSGANTGLRFDIRAFSGGVFTLWQAAPFTPLAGDAYTAVAGCDKTFATCGTRFANTLNFGGFPHIPGLDAVLQTPDAKI